MKKKASYVPSKSINERANEILGEIRRKQAVEDLSKSNRRIGLKPLDASGMSTFSEVIARKTTQTTTKSNSSKK